MRFFAGLLAVGLILAVAGTAGAGSTFNGVADNQTDALGYYYTISGGLFPTGTTPNGDAASGGTLRYVTDDPGWGTSIDVWHKDGWYAGNSGIAVTLKNGAATVYDNNGLENGSFPTNFYTYNAITFPTQGAGAVTGYSMSNNFDWIYAGYMKLTDPTTITALTGYFAYNTNPADVLTGGFNPANPDIRFRMNIWSNVSGDLLPTNTGSFAGDVFASDRTAGLFAFSDTSYNRVGSSSQQDIYRLTYTLDSPVTLGAGEYWFSHDAVIVPEPLTMAGLMLGIGGLVGYVRNRRKA
jgi:hypothetical protein